MSMRDANRAVRNEAALILKNPKLRQMDILEWSTGQVEPEDGEIVIYLPTLNVHAAFPASVDKRRGR